MNRITVTRKISSLFSPIISQRVRAILYPRKLAFKQNIDFSAKSITGSVFYGNISDFVSYPFCFHGYFDWKIVVIANTILKNTKGDIVEIGANIGTETISFCDILKLKGKVHAFEPLPGNFKSLERIKQDHDNLVLYNCAISDKKGKAFFQLPYKYNSGTGKIVNCNTDCNDEMIEVKTTVLDDYLGSIKNSKLILIDTEGHEPSVLKGGIKVISKDRPVVIIEVISCLLSEYSNDTPKTIYDYFHNLNYCICRIGKLKLIKIEEKDLSCDLNCNWICIPEESKSIKLKLESAILKRAFIPWYLLKSLPN